jgi:N-acetylglutamate synthase-like GNAT family acetyltransferase
MIRVRRYRAADFEDCLALFDANTPEFFGVHERIDLERFLQGDQGLFLVAEYADRLSACGGIEIFADRGIAEFRWVMVAPAAKGLSLGRLLLLLSAAHTFQLAGFPVILVHTTPKSAEFFRKLGFASTTIRVEKNHWAPGLDLELLSLAPGRDCVGLAAAAVSRYSPGELVVDI